MGIEISQWQQALRIYASEPDFLFFAGPMIAGFVTFGIALFWIAEDRTMAFLMTVVIA
jgi:hypothetical protein